VTPLHWSLAFLLVGAVLHYVFSRPKTSSTTIVEVGRAGIWAGVAGLLLVQDGPW
jgi:hypothetical protein